MDIEKNLAWIREQNLRERREIEQRRQKALQALQDIVHCLREQDPGISEIILFGSLARKEENLRLNFDIDLAIKCTQEKYYSLVSLVQDLTEFQIDLVDLDSAAGMLRKRILEEGIVLYEA